MRDSEIIRGFEKVEKRMNSLINEMWLVSYHFSALQRVLRDKGLVTSEQHNAELLKMQAEIKAGQVKEEPVKEEPKPGDTPDDKQAKEGVQEAVPNAGDTAGQVLPNKELPDTQAGAVSTSPARKRWWWFGRNR